MRIRVFLFLLVLLPNSVLNARPKKDVIVMTNGDRLTCEVKRLDRGILVISLDYVDGSVSVEWSKVDHIESSQPFKIETEEGLIYSGTIRTASGKASRPRKIDIVDEKRGQEAVVAQSEVVVARQLEGSVWQNFHGSFSSGFIYADAGKSTQYSFASEITYHRERVSLEFDYQSSLSSATGAERSTRNQVDLKGQRKLRWSKWYYAGATSFLQSSAQGISIQSVFGGGFGRFLKNTNTAGISLMGGFALQRTHYKQQPAENLLVGLIVGDVNVFKFKKTNLSIKPVLLPSISEPGRVRLNLNAQYRLQIVSDWWWNITFYGNWDNRPPAGLIGSDYGASVGLSYSFH